MRGNVRGQVRSVWLSALVFVEMQLLHLLLQEGNRHGAASGSLWQCVDLSVWGRMYKRVVVVSPLVLFLRCPHSRICLSGAVRQCRISCVIFPNRGALVVFCVVTLGKNKGLLF